MFGEGLKTWPHDLWSASAALWRPWNIYFRQKTSDNMERWNAENGRVEERTRVRRKQMQVREMLGKLRNGSRGTWFIPMICGSGCSKSRLVKATGAEPPFLHPFCILFVHAVLNQLCAMWLLLVAWKVDWVCFCFKQCVSRLKSTKIRQNPVGTEAAQHLLICTLPASSRRLLAAPPQF